MGEQGGGRIFFQWAGEERSRNVNINFLLCVWSAVVCARLLFRFDGKREEKGIDFDVCVSNSKQ